MRSKWKTFAALKPSSIRYLDNSKPELLQAIREKRELNDDIKGQLKNAITEVKNNSFQSEKAPAKAQ